MAKAAAPCLPSETQGGHPRRCLEGLCHIDVTIIRLLDGTKAYLHAVIDNFSRRILAWTLEERLGAGGTCRVLLEAGRQLGTRPVETTVVTDSGMENVNENVDVLLAHEGLRHVLAQVEVSFSNSMIEACWRSLRHASLCLHNLDDPATLRRLIAFYVRAHNETIPHAAFNGQTPDEIYFGNGDVVVIDLAATRLKARQERMKANRMAACRVCAGEPEVVALQLQRAESRMPWDAAARGLGRAHSRIPSGERMVPGLALR